MSKNKSKALDRKIEAYPQPYYHRLVTGYVAIHEVSRSEVVCQALKLYFDTMPQDQKSRLMNHAQSITEKGK